jgi:hypothetical protein
MKLNKTLVLSVSAVFVFVVNSITLYDAVAAVKATDFQAGRIIDDEIFYNKNSMTVAEIQAFIEAKTPVCDTWGNIKITNKPGYNGLTRAEYVQIRTTDGTTNGYHTVPFVCLRNYAEHPETNKTNFETNAVKEEGMLSSAEIIYKAAQMYNVNPQVLLTIMKKEMSQVWTDDWPMIGVYNYVMGYGCPDTGPDQTAACNAKYKGFYKQVMHAAWQFNNYKETMATRKYRPGLTWDILYSPNTACGTKSVYVQNNATASLYIYTPYTPNDGALNNYPGEASCGAYGNRNFFMIFSNWFGSTLVSESPKPPEPPVEAPDPEDRRPLLDILKNFSVNSEQNTILGLKAGTTLQDLINKADLSGGETLQLSSDKVATGVKLRIIKNSEQLYELTLVVKGDMNGDGRVSSGDLSVLLQHVAELSKLTNEKLLAADLNGDGRASSADLSKLLRVVAELEEL